MDACLGGDLKTHLNCKHKVSVPRTEKPVARFPPTVCAAFTLEAARFYAAEKQ